MVTGVRYAPRPHNHRSKPAYAVGTAALTLSDHADAADWLTLALEQQNTTTRYQFCADGVYREGSHYWVYTLVNALPFLWQYRAGVGVDLFPAYQPTFEWAVQVRDRARLAARARRRLPQARARPTWSPLPTPTAPTDLHPTAPLGEVLQWNWADDRLFHRQLHRRHERRGLEHRRVPDRRRHHPGHAARAPRRRSGSQRPDRPPRATGTRATRTRGRSLFHGVAERRQPRPPGPALLHARRREHAARRRRRLRPGRLLGRPPRHGTRRRRRTTW